ncbi:MAG: UDP-2-acetamido-2-deoxy-ribo-hexuluronate aminotransferase [Saprospiraceae bacterium]
MSIPFIDLKTQYQQNSESIDKAVLGVLKHGQYIMGPEIKELEAQLADFIGVKHVVSCGSGTDALQLPLMAKELSASDAIFTTPFTFFASTESITLAGATPVFVDIDPNTYNIDPADLVRKISETIAEGKLTPKGIMPVDLFGLAADYDAINDIAKQHDLFVIEDAAQSFAAGYHGRKACGLADVGATSFYPAKPLGCYGDGGAVFTDDTGLYEEMVSLRVHGQAVGGDKYDNVRVGLNARMDTIQAAVLLEKLKLYPQEIIERNRVADCYAEHLEGLVKTPTVPEGQTSVWAQYSVQSDSREEIKAALQEKGIPMAVFYPIPIHLSTAYKFLGHQEGDFLVSEAASKRICSLPMHPYLQEGQVKQIADVIASVVHK